MPPPRHFVRVPAPLPWLLLSVRPSLALALWRGALVSPFGQSCILCAVRARRRQLTLWHLRHWLKLRMPAPASVAFVAGFAWRCFATRGRC